MACVVALPVASLFLSPRRELFRWCIRSRQRRVLSFILFLHELLAYFTHFDEICIVSSAYDVSNLVL